MFQGAHHNFLDTTSNVARMTNFKLEDETETQGKKVFIYLSYFKCLLL